MAYCLADDILKQLPGFASSEAEIAEALTLSIAEADSIIDSKLASRFPVPFAAKTNLTSPPKIIESISRILTRSIFLSGSYLANAENTEPKLAGILWDRAMSLMEMLTDGSMTIPDLPNEALSNVSPGIISNTRNKTPNLRTFDLRSTLSPDLHTQMRKSNPRASIHGDSCELDPGF
mgnify:CR=1 FL=1